MSNTSSPKLACIKTLTGGAAIRKSLVAALLFASTPAGVLAQTQESQTPDVKASDPLENGSSFAGTYDGNQMEMAARLVLGEDGRYRYALSCGAVDEFSSGTWTGEAAGVVLTSDPSLSPEFEYLGAEPGTGPADALTIRIEGPVTLPLSLFRVVATRADGSSFETAFENEALTIPVAPGADVTSVQLTLPMFEIAGDPVEIAQAAGNRLYFAFQPNDLGFTVFNRAVLPWVNDALVLERYGRTIEFRKLSDEFQAEPADDEGLTG
jgi:hypothetical protein